jgi:ANTAR domain
VSAPLRRVLGLVPCLAAAGRRVSVAEADSGQRWPRFAAAATQAGFAAVHALPMRLRDQVIGALNLFSGSVGRLGEAELRIGQALADVATIGLLQEQNVRRAETLAEQLQAALNSRVVIEQAKGRLAERLGLDMDQSFALLRGHARNTNQRLTDVARHIIDSPSGNFPSPAPGPPRGQNTPG